MNRHTAIKIELNRLVEGAEPTVSYDHAAQAALDLIFQLEDEIERLRIECAEWAKVSAYNPVLQRRENSRYSDRYSDGPISDGGMDPRK
jgi:hypothetical protein